VNVTLALAVWPLVAVAAFKWLAPRTALILVFLGGWIVLPVGVYPVGATGGAFPYWLVGAALPSDMLLSKAWVAPVSALLGVLLWDRKPLAACRFGVWDVPMLLWCVWPLLQSTLAADAQPDPLWASLYLAGSWGVPWLLGRVYFGTPDAQGTLLQGLAWAGLACLPFAVLEGVFGQHLYAIVFEPHPFAADGVERYWAWRPLGFFENGNQYGIWISLCALAALWVWRSQRRGAQRVGWAACAVAVVTMAVLAQSIGALLLLGVGLAGLLVMARLSLQKFLLATLVVVVVGSAVYLSGLVPLTHWAKETAVGQKVVGVFKASGRGSFTWRIAQDQKAIALVKPVVLAGHGRWDWWRELGTRPWGLVLLVVGQFGLVGCAFAFGSLLAPAMARLWRAPVASPWTTAGAPTVLAVVVILMLLDAVLNSFVFFPAVLVSGALVLRIPATIP